MLAMFGGYQTGRKLAKKKNPPRPGGQGGPALATLDKGEEKSKTN